MFLIESRDFEIEKSIYDFDLLGWFNEQRDRCYQVKIISRAF